MPLMRVCKLRVVLKCVSLHIPFIDLKYNPIDDCNQDESPIYPEGLLVRSRVLCDSPPHPQVRVNQSMNLTPPPSSSSPFLNEPLVQRDRARAGAGATVRRHRERERGGDATTTTRDYGRTRETKRKRKRKRGRTN